MNRPLIVSEIKTEVCVLYAILSHSNQKPASDFWPGEGEEPQRPSNVTYAVVSQDGRNMVEVSPFHGPFTYIHGENLLEKYKNREDLDRSGWAQGRFDESGFVQAAYRGDVETMARILWMELEES